MQILQFIVSHWAQILLSVSEILGVLGFGGIAKQVLDVLMGKGLPPASPAPQAATA